MTTGPQTGTQVSQPSLSTENKTRIAIIDDHAIVREGLARLIHREMELAVCGFFEGSENALESVAAFHADMVNVEIALNGIDGIGLIKSIRTQFLKCLYSCSLCKRVDSCKAAAPWQKILTVCSVGNLDFVVPLNSISFCVSISATA